MKDTVAYLGMGLMGAPMARNLLKAGYSVVVYNRTREKAQSLVAEGAQLAESPAEAARMAQVVIACLTDAEAVETCVTGPAGRVGSVVPV